MNKIIILLQQKEYFIHTQGYRYISQQCIFSLFKAEASK